MDTRGPFSRPVGRWSYLHEQSSSAFAGTGLYNFQDFPTHTLVSPCPREPGRTGVPIQEEGLLPRATQKLERFPSLLAELRTHSSSGVESQALGLSRTSLDAVWKPHPLCRQALGSTTDMLAEGDGASEPALGSCVPRHSAWVHFACPAHDPDVLLHADLTRQDEERGW